MTGDERGKFTQRSIHNPQRFGLAEVFVEDENQLAGLDATIFAGDPLDEVPVGLEALLVFFHRVDLLFLLLDLFNQRITLLFQATPLGQFGRNESMRPRECQTHE